MVKQTEVRADLCELKEMPESRMGGSKIRKEFYENTGYKRRVSTTYKKT